MVCCFSSPCPGKICIGTESTKGVLVQLYISNRFPQSRICVCVEGANKRIQSIGSRWWRTCCFTGWLGLLVAVVWWMGTFREPSWLCGLPNCVTMVPVVVGTLPIIQANIEMKLHIDCPQSMGTCTAVDCQTSTREFGKKEDEPSPPLPKLWESCVKCVCSAPCSCVCVISTIFHQVWTVSSNFYWIQIKWRPRWWRAVM